MSLKFRRENPGMVGKPLTPAIAKKARESTQIKCTLEEKRTREEFAKELDINRIVDKYTKTGVLPFAGRENLGIYADFSELPDYKSQLDFVISAKESFQKLDANVRKRFDNNPGKLLDFLKDPKNLEEGRRLGLIEPERPEPPAEPSPAPEPDPLPASEPPSA